MQLANPQHEQFAQFVAEGQPLNQSAIQAGYKASSAANMGSRLMRNNLIKLRVEELRHVHGDDVAEIGLRTSEGRVSALEDRWQRLRQIITARAADPEMETVPGGKTGLLVCNFKQVGGKAEHQRFVKEWRVDTGLLAELRAHEEQAAEELGQRISRSESYRQQSVSVSLQTPTQINASIRQGLAELPKALRDKAIEENPELSNILDVEPIPAG